MNLISAHWPTLEDINLRKIYKIEEHNFLTNEGCQYLREAKWATLKCINLRNLFNKIKITIKSKPKDARVYQKQIGLFSKSSD